MTIQNIIIPFLIFLCIGGKGQNAYFTDLGSNYGFENIIAKQAFLCIQKGCFDGLKRTAFIDDSTSYNPDLIIANLKKHKLYEALAKGDFFYEFRVDNDIPPLTFYRTFENADSTIFLQLKLELKYKGGLLYCKSIETLTENFFKINISSPWGKYKMDRGSRTNVPFPPPPPSRPAPDLIYPNRGLRLCGNCDTEAKREVFVDRNRRFWLWEQYSYDQIVKLGGKKYRVEQNNRLGIVNKDNEILLPIIYDKIVPFSIGVYEVWRDGKVGFVNKEFTETIPTNFDDLKVRIGRFPNKEYDGIVILSKNKKWGVKNIEGNEIVPIKYDSVALYNSKFYIVKSGNKYGLLDLVGNEILAPNYDEMTVPYSYPLFSVIVKRRKKRIMLLFEENKVVQKVKLNREVKITF